MILRVPVLALAIVAGVAMAQTEQDRDNVLAREVLVDAGAAMEREGKVTDAIRVYRRAVRMGSGAAALRLANIYDRGVPGVPRDYKEAMRWYVAAQDLGEKIPIRTRSERMRVEAEAQRQVEIVRQREIAAVQARDAARKALEDATRKAQEAKSDAEK